MKRIKLTQGKFALVDDADFEWLNQWKWCADESGNTCYALRAKSCKVGRIRMHCLIMGARQGYEIDHINDNGLDNKRLNLRFCTHAENHQKAPKRKGCSSKYKGVHWNIGNNKWVAKIKVNSKYIHLSCFKSEKKAGHCYDIAAIKYYGEHAWINSQKNRHIIVAALVAGEETE